MNKLGPRELTDEEIAEREKQIEEIVRVAKEKIDAFATPAEFRYGDNRTIHSSGTIDVCVDKLGNVKQVWFRCMMLPFTQSERSDREYTNPKLNKIKAIVFEKAP